MGIGREENMHYTRSTDSALASVCLDCIGHALDACVGYD